MKVAAIPSSSLQGSTRLVRWPPWTWRYKGARVDEPKKDKFDKRLKGPLSCERRNPNWRLAEVGWTGLWQ